MSDRQYREMIAPLTFGDLVVRWPEQMSTSDHNDMAAYVALILRMVKRSAEQLPYVPTEGEVALLRAQPRPAQGDGG